MRSAPMHKLAKVVSIALLFAASAFSQGERGTITGTVTDTSGGIVTGAAITLRNVATNIRATATANNSGLFVFPALNPGTYDITVEKPGFKAKKVSNIPLATGTTVTIDTQLEVGAVSESVNVEASAVQLEVQTSGLSKVVEARKVVELPLLGRNPLNLASTAPGVIPTSAQGGNGAGAIGSATNSRISGGLAQQNAVLMDGGESRGFTSGGQAYSVPIESVEEFKVETATYSAEYGHSGGGVVNVATKSGTNSLHGVVYEFLRNDHLNANGWSNNRNRVPRALFQSNTFGAAAGGPIKRDRTFFFVNYEGVRSGTPDQFLSTVPTAEQKAGDFSRTLDPQGRVNVIYDPLTTRVDPANPGRLIRDAFPGNRIPAERIHPISKNVVNYWPAPNRPGEGPVGVRNYFLSGKNVNRADIWFARIDHQLSAKHRLFGRTGGSQNDSASTLAEKAFPARTISSQPTRTGLVSLTSTWTQALLGEGRFSYTRLQFNSYPVSEGFDMGTLGFSKKVQDNVLYKQFPQITVQQYNSGSGLVVSTFGAEEVGTLGGATKTLAPQDNWHAQYHVTWIKGSHKFRFGTDHQLMRMHAYNSQFSAGQYFFDRTYSQGPDPSVSATNSGHGFASLLLGVPQAGTLTFTPRMFLFQRYKSGYFQDDWRVNNRLTLNIGVRYEYTSPYGEKWGNIGYIDPNEIEPVTGGKGVFKWVPPGGYHTDPNYKTFGPRVGLAYRLSSKTVIRTGGAIFFAANNGLNAAATDFGSGTFVTNFVTLGESRLAFTPPTGGSWSDPFAGGFTYPQKGITTFAGQPIRVDVKNHPLAYISNWNFGIQREITPTMIAEVAYVGSKITHLFWNRQDNQNNPLLVSLGSQLTQSVPNPFAGKVTVGALSFPSVQQRQLLRPFPHYQDVLHIRANYGDSQYQSMTARFEKRYSQGLTMSVGYTLSKTISSVGGDSNTWVVGPSNALYNPKYNRGLEANDLPHRVVISHLYDLPFGKGRRWATTGLASAVLGGWAWNGITVFQAGRPILITGPDDTNLLNFSYTNGRADRLKSGVLASGQTLDRWFDTTAFVRAKPYTIPTDSLTQPDLRGPGRKSLDMSIFKNTRFRERFNIQFRAEVFNLTNSPFFEARNQTTDVTNQDFGKILQGSNPRNIQFGVRVLF
ncbi:MAG TPA: carboxypeptidase regulatory-like domain-containing protein [Bryobacteraceae bacterium]|nr:carboxypeptidase regulatory-like domain-containing protein [Bryobacteraceae bacterium]